MHRTCINVLLLLCLLGMVQCRRPAAGQEKRVYGTELSFADNPSGNWQVGYSTDSTLDPSQFHLCAFSDTSHAIALWHPGAGSAAYYPYTAQNRSTQTQVDPTNSWALRPGEIAMEGNNNGQYSMLRFIVPSKTRVHMKVVFEGVHFRLSSTDVHILKNSTRLFDDIIDGYGGDSTYHSKSGRHPVSVYEATLDLDKGDIITFALGYGENKTFYNDTTGLLITLKED